MTTPFFRIAGPIALFASGAGVGHAVWTPSPQVVRVSPHMTVIGTPTAVARFVTLASQDGATSTGTLIRTDGQASAIVALPAYADVKTATRAALREGLGYEMAVASDSPAGS